MAWIRKSIKKSITWMWIGSITIFISVVLQMVALYYPSHTLTLAMIGLSLNAISVPVTVVLAYMSAREFEQERRTREAAEQRVWNDTPSGRQHAALSQLRTEMHMDSQEPHS
jgi:hypothetical protein